MRIIIKTQNIALTSEIEKLVAEKLAPLEKFTDGFGKDRADFICGKEKAGLEMKVKISKDSLHRQKGKIFRVGAWIRFPGKELGAEVSAADLEMGITELKDRLQPQFKRYKEKLTARKKGNKDKKMRPV